jgi:hypothetical protein
MQVGDGCIDEGGYQALEIESGLSDEGAEARPAWKALLAGDRQLGIVEGGRCGVEIETRKRGGFAGLRGLEQSFRLLAVELKIEAQGLGMGRHTTSFQFAPVVRIAG